MTAGISRRPMTDRVSYFHDVGPAREMGIRCVWVDRDNTGEYPAAATERITGLAELPETISKLGV